MAYFIFNSNVNQLYRIARNDSEKDSLDINNDSEGYVIKTVSDEDFNKIVFQKYSATLNGDAVELTNIFSDEVDVYVSAEELDVIIQFHIKFFQDRLMSYREHPRINDIKNYIKILQTFDTSTVVFPLNKHWEEYCHDNSITFIHPLQII